MVRPGRSAHQAGAGRLPRAGALCDLPVLPHGHAGDHLPVFGVLRLRRAAHGQAALHQDRHLHRRRLFRHAAADDIPEEPHHAKADVDQARLSGHARSAADLRGVRHVDRGGAAPGEQRDRLAVGGAGGRAHADDGGAVLSAGPPPSLRESGQTHRPGRRALGLHGLAAG